MYYTHCSSAKTLVISYIGMQTQEVDIKPNIKVFMRSDSEMLDEVMVVAYGTAKKSAFTGSASVIKSETLEKRQVSNLSNALSGTVSGVQTQSTNGQPGTSATVRIRGIGSMYASNNPLYVVDGIPYEGDISAVNSQDIESMTVLKDAAAAALYGARGANGVILVTTKKGKSGDTQISLDARWGVNSRLVKNYDVLQNANTYMETAYSALYNGYLYNSGYTAERAYQLANADLFPKLGYQVYTIPDGQYLIGRNGKLNPYATLGYSDGDYYYTPDNWSDEMFQSNLRQEYNLSVSGGSDKLSYYLSASYLNDEGIIENSGFERISTRMNVDYQAKKWLKLGVNLSYSNVTSRSPGDQDTDAATSSGNAFFVGNFIAPIYPMYVRNADGSFQYNANTGYHVYDYGDGSSTNFTRNFMSMSNPMSGFLYDTEKYLMDILNGKWYAKIDIIDGLSLTASLGLHIDNTRQHSVGNKYYGQSASYGGSVMQYSSRVYSLDQQYLLNYKKTFGNHNLDILAGYESMDFNTESHYILGYNMYSDKNWTASNVIDRKNGSGSYNEYATIGIITRASYDFNEKYYGSVSYRRDASSRFHPDNRWGNFWSVSAAWDMAKENFISQYDWINMLKLKASFGQQGNDNLYYKGYTNYYPYLDQFTVSGSDGVFSDGVLYYKGSKDITWETSNSFNVGVDFALLGGRIDGTIEYFNRQTKDMLYYKPVAMSNGYTQLPMNIGSVRNSGVEIELNYTPIETNDLKWVINWNGTLMKNKILELHPDLKGEMIDGSYIYREGESLYQMYLTKYAGVDPDSGEALYWAKDENGVEYKDKDWSAAYNSNRQASGDLLPTIYGGVGTTLEFRGFDFSIQCAYQLGGTIYDSGYQAFMHGGDSHYMGYNWHKDILNAWTPENRNTNIPRVDAIDKYTNSSSDRWLTSSDYFSINNITLGYTLPKRWLRSLGIGSLRIYGAADNVALFSARKGLDPRMSYTTASTDRYTPIRTISGGLKVTF
ncbi:SusC/RagA family TonB-linked outer membrane protein [Bacteroides uniformis]|uniref:SusC/RagA family TonB-linked outer membrane protein n=1 Tax=Bacteroides TaxID=816 RepID=UPI0021651E55|nr:MULTISPECIES: SusC/RagA family TonB-linked outer membrane protein [Bacteroides]MCS2339588.1 SusC/RagA family TonB-linked outer membrane protein [Bacteroides uniformis]MCS2413474.1 SusC/RagA family TonB-linked outer membrane protein [Bacteroides uniformis]MDC1777749.1 SusC/RagA family TonB-linked outer membrane protein [Bacteroides uniformis]MDC1778584.1 SusC/RagA family TonB-linked outer membrane protein [Bacteroides uniformis]MDC1782149.1 SusC/RagA family TonB-linked outer membrane protein